ncbi:hypothetical protein JVT61DRAFT_14695 [Boletus reticuloceps]|uniref:Uncharacterized protein n=1 Tax=Boletus reticuloceps TaxID=495285 RepID=A0A8I2YT70_9AGAM|nr:hypothetical protein JVT61DRAFT_14695 [Boletus reticuloceps]
MEVGQDECACAHSLRDHHAPPVPSLPLRLCHGNRFFATSDDPPTARSNCTLCNRPYFMHIVPNNDQANSDLAPSTPNAHVLLSYSTATGSTQVTNNRSLLDGNSLLSPLTASGGSSTGSLQAYLCPIGSLLPSTSAATLPPLTQQHAPAFSHWNPPAPPPAGSTNDRRVYRATTAARGVAASPFQSSAMVLGQRRRGSMQRIQQRRSTPSSRLPHGFSARKYVVVIHPEPVSH